MLVGKAHNYKEEKNRVIKNKIGEKIMNVVQGYGINNLIVHMTIKENGNHQRKKMIS